MSEARACVGACVCLPCVLAAKCDLCVCVCVCVCGNVGVGVRACR